MICIKLEPAIEAPFLTSKDKDIFSPLLIPLELTFT